MYQKRPFICMIFMISILVLPSCTKPPSMISAVVQNCLPIQEEIPASAEVSGTLILFYTHTPPGLDPQNEDISYAYDLRTQQIVPLHAPFNRAEVQPNNISPDRKKLATVISHLQGNQYEEHIMILTAEGEQYEGVPWPYAENQRLDFIGWFDNNRVLLSIDDNPYPFSGEQERTFGVALLYNPFSGESELILPSFLELYDRSSAQDSTGQLFPLYDPSLSRVFLYISDESGKRLVLWNVHEREVMWERNITHPYLNEPAWSPQGDRIVFILPTPDDRADNFYSVSRQGQETQLTDLGSREQPSSIVGWPQRYSWSPDGRRIAFWWRDGKRSDLYANVQLAVLDLEEEVITQYCIRWGSGYPPVWSPDGRQIAVTTADIYEREDGGPPIMDFQTIVIVDLEQNLAFRIPGVYNLGVTGWMLPFPIRGEVLP